MSKRGTLKIAKKQLSLIVVIVVIATMVMHTYASDHMYDFFKHKDSQLNYGRGFSEKTDSGDLCWVEGVVLDSYMDTYEAYKDTYWLDKFVSHFDRVKASAEDRENDGYYGWYSHRYSLPHMQNLYFNNNGQDINAPELLKNGGFEEAVQGDSLTPKEWTRTHGDSSVVYRTTQSGTYFSGNAGLLIKYNNGSWAILAQDLDYIPGQEYTVSFVAKTNSRNTLGRVDILDETEGKTIAITTGLGNESIFVDEWFNYSFNFKAPEEAGHTLKIRFRLSYADRSDWEVYYDDVSVKAVEAPMIMCETVKNGDLETVDASDTTLPDEWTRGGVGVNSSLVFLTGEEYHSASHSAVVKSNGTTWLYMEQEIDYKPGAQYKVSFWGKTNSSSAYGRVSASDITSSTTIAQKTFNGTEWGNYGFVFTAPSEEGHVLKIRLMQNNYTDSSWIAYFDDVTIEAINENLVDNYDMEILDSQDSTLPDGWERSQSTSQTAFISTQVNEYYQGSKGLVIKSNDTQVPMLRQKLYYSPGVEYTVAFMGRNSNPQAQGQVDIYNSTNDAVIKSLTFEETAWTTKSFKFTAPFTTSDSIYIRLKQNSTNSSNLTTYFDNVKVEPYSKKGFRAWNRVNKDQNTAYGTSGSGEYFLQPYALAITNDGSTDGYVEQQIMAYTPGKAYGVSVYGKTNNALTGGKIIVYDETTSQTLTEVAFYNTEWQYVKSSFTTPTESGHVLKIRLSQTSYTNPLHTAYFDYIFVGEEGQFFVHETMISKPVLKFVKAVYDNPDLQSAYLTKANIYLDFIEDDVLPKWESYYRDLGSGKGVYVFPEGNLGSWFAGKSLPHNQYLVASECYLYLWDITGNNSYRTRASSLLSTFKSCLTTNSTVSTAFEWKYWDPLGSWDDGFWAGSSIEDVSHANLDIAAAITAYDYGVVFEASDLNKFISTYLDVMWNGSYSLPVLGQVVNKQGSTTLELISWTPQQKGWLKLARYNHNIWDIVKAIAKNRGNADLSALANLAVLNQECGVNGGFELEDMNDNTLPLSWSRWLATSQTAFRDSTNRYNGDYGLTIKTNGSTWQIIEQQIKDYVPNSDYTLKFYAKTGDSQIRARGEIYDYTSSSVLATAFVDTTTWSSASVSFTTPGTTGNNIRIRLYTNLYDVADKYVSFDNVRVYPSLWNSFVPNGGFEEENMYDSTLPEYWERTSATLASNAAICTSEKYKGNSSLKLVTDISEGEQKLEYQLSGYTTGASYKLTFYCKTNGSSAGAKAYVYNETTGTTLASQTITGTSWSSYEVNFTAPSTYTDVVKVVLTHNDPDISGGEAYFDELGVLLQ